MSLISKETGTYVWWMNHDRVIRVWLTATMMCASSTAVDDRSRPSATDRDGHTVVWQTQNHFFFNWSKTYLCTSFAINRIIMKEKTEQCMISKRELGSIPSSKDKLHALQISSRQKSAFVSSIFRFSLVYGVATQQVTLWLWHLLSRFLFLGEYYSFQHCFY